jgi:hypothetical protein
VTFAGSNAGGGHTITGNADSEIGVTSYLIFGSGIKYGVTLFLMLVDIARLSLPRQRGGKPFVTCAYVAGCMVALASPVYYEIDKAPMTLVVLRVVRGSSFVAE